MLKVKNIKLTKHVDCFGGIMTDRFDAVLYDILKDTATREYIVFKREGAQSDQTYTVPFEAVTITTYFKREDVLPTEKPATDEDGEPVKRGPGRPPKQHNVLA